MPRIVSVGTAVPPYVFPQARIREFAREFFSDTFKDIERLLAVFESANINERHFAVPFEWFGKQHSLAEKNQIYLDSTVRLGCEAISDCLKNTGLTPDAIDHIIFVSSTGLATPSIDAYIANELRMKLNLRRTPIWGLGCAGGAVGLSRAAEYVRGNPRGIAITVAVELCGLTFLPQDKSKSNLIATSLFADGAAAVLTMGDEVQGIIPQGPRIVDSVSTIWPETLDIMGWDIMDSGFKVIFSKDIPTIVKQKLFPQVEKFLQQYKLTISDLQFFIAHPGGTKVLEAYQESLSLPEEYLAGAKKVLANNGNMSAPTVLFVLKEALENYQPKGGYGMMAALGPGFSSELLLLHW